MDGAVDQRLNPVPIPKERLPAMSSSSSSAPDPLPLRWAIILMVAGVVAMLIGALTFMQTGSWLATLLAALGTGGMSIPVVNQVLGR